jgi:hypothetical protein
LIIGKIGLRPIFRTSASLPGAKGVALAPCARGQLRAADFSDIGFVAAGKRRGFCRLLSR